MQNRKKQGDPIKDSTIPGRRARIRHRVRILACFLAMTVLAGAAHPGQEPLPPPGTPDRPSTHSVANQLPDAIAQMKMRDQQAKEKSFELANTERKRQIAEDSAKLLKLATDLKIEVDKTNKDTLSLIVIRNADEIERLALNVKEKMKLTVGSS